MGGVIHCHLFPRVRLHLPIDHTLLNIAFLPRIFCTIFWKRFLALTSDDYPSGSARKLSGTGQLVESSALKARVTILRRNVQNEQFSRWSHLVLAI